MAFLIPLFLGCLGLGSSKKKLLQMMMNTSQILLHIPIFLKIYSNLDNIYSFIDDETRIARPELPA